ncbi:MAG TPA: galactose-1-phosphate uridylyltransferase [Terriglobia bacterium]|nr:galactose-1-phosphate uridylyltransferase [Terriglobia bacterium]
MGSDVQWEERWHPLREEWVIVAAHRQNRPWSGAEAPEAEAAAVPEYVENCYLCPGNLRVSGRRNEPYSGIFVFDNDHPCVGSNAPTDLQTPAGIFRNRPANGVARVVCYSPKHNLSLAELNVEDIENLLNCWREQYVELGARPEVNHVFTFENRGAVVGVSNPHPHCQIYATNFVFKIIENEARISRKHYAETGRVLFQEILKGEHDDGRRILYENGSAITFVPYFARYAYECYVAPKEAHPNLASLSRTELRDFALALKTLLVKYENLWRMPFPYVMILHEAPTDGRDYAGFHFHIEFYPPLRKPGLLKYLAGPEIGGGNFLSDTLPEDKATELRNAPNTHYKVADATDRT